MSSFPMHHNGITDYVIHKQHDQSPHVSRSIHLHQLTGKLPNHRLSTAVNAAVTYNSGHNSDLSLFNNNLDLQSQTDKIHNTDYKSNDRTSIENPRVSESLDEWMKNSVTEIVKNITQTPLLIQIYDNGEVKTEKALPEKSNNRNHRSYSSSVEGVILVEEITGAEDSGETVAEDDGARVYGVLIQGRVKGRSECKSTCYLLKTSSGDGGGLGFVCRHFCLMKVKSFHENVFSQFRDCWLV